VTAEELMEMDPSAPWDRPVLLAGSGGEGYACRVCAHLAVVEDSSVESVERMSLGDAIAHFRRHHDG
jgi:hypothetical protein